MSAQGWTPPNIAAICPEQQAPLTQCSTTGYLFLALISQLYSGSRDIKHTDYSNYWEDQGTTQPFTDNGPYFLGPHKTPYTQQHFEPIHQDFFSEKLMTPVKTTTRVHSIGPDGSRGLSQTSSYFPTIDFETYKPLDIDFEQSQDSNENFNKKRNHFPNSRDSFGNTFSKYRPADFEFGFEKNIFSDIDTAHSEKVTTKVDKKISAKRSRKKRSIERYDFIVVGAGSAGCVVANRLSEVKHWKVLLIEAGPEEPEVTSVPAFAPVLGRSSIDWNYRTQPEEMTCRAQRGQTCPWLSGRVMGGSSAINYVVYMRGNKKDYDQWAALGNEGWSYNEVLPYFKKSEDNKNVEAKDIDHHATGGPLNVERFAYTDPNVVMIVKAFHEKGFPLVDFNGKRQLGTMTTQTTSKDGRRVSANTAFIRPIRNRRNLIIKTNSQVTKILINDKKVAYGVRYFYNGVAYEVQATKEVIISAGALNSPKILMLSGIGPRADLELLKIPVIANLKVGHNLQDHATTEAVLLELSNKTSTSLPGKEMLRIIRDFQKYNANYDKISAPGVLHVTAFHRTKYAGKDKTIPDIQFHFDGRNKRDFYADPSTYLATSIFPFTFYDSLNVRPILLSPESRGYLKLNRTHPVFGQPLIYPRFFTAKNDLDTLVAALKFATTLEKTKAFIENNVKFVRKQVKPCTSYLWGSNKYFTCVLTSYTGTIYHPAGTCKMGPLYDKNAVVDARLRVYGIQNLRVADASIMPQIVRGNTNAPCMMIGEKVSDMIKEDWDTVHYGV